MLPENEEIDLIEIFQILLKNKLLIIFLTLCGFFSVTTYQILEKPIYEVSTKIVYGKFDNLPLQNFEEVESTINFYFEDVFAYDLGKNYLSLKTREDSEEEALLLMDNVIEKIISDSKDISDYKMRMHNELLNSTEKKINDSLMELDKFSLIESPNIEQQIYLSELRLGISNERSYFNNILSQKNNPNFFKEAEVSETESVTIKKINYRLIIFITFLSFFISCSFVALRGIFLKK